jgi:hypothetical protein
VRIEDEPTTATDERAAEPAERRGARSPRVLAGQFVASATVPLLAGLGVVAATFGNVQRVADVDPQYTRDLVERTIRYGGTYYENGIHNKGPLEPFVYHVAAWLTSWDGYWYTISAFVAGIALVLAFAAGRCARFTGGNAPLGVAAGAVVFVHFTLSGSDYAGVLYSRNLTTALLALAWVVTFAARPWRSARGRLLAAAATGALVGLAVQSLTSTVFAGAVILGVALLALRYREQEPEHGRDGLVPLAGTMLATAAIVFASAPLYYAARGRFTEFWSGWFTYATYMSTGTGRSLGSQFALGWDRLYEYYQNRPLTFVVIISFVVFTATAWKSRDQLWRLFHVGLLGWLAAAWVEMILSQRYSSHYFSITSVPTALMAAALAGDLYRTLTEHDFRLRGELLWPFAAALLAVYLSGPHYFTDGYRAALDFDGVAAHAAERDRNEDGGSRTTRAVLDLVSRPGDPLLVWTNHPWPYLELHRVSATRFIWNSFLLGEIYLGRTSPDYVLDDSWKWFADDLDESRPVAFLEEEPLEGTSNPFTDYVNRDFERVYESETPLYLRDDVADAVLRGATERRWTPPDPPSAGSPWTARAGTARFGTPDGERGAEELVLSEDSCFRLEGIAGGGSGPAALVFRFTDVTGASERLGLTLEDGRAASVSDTVEFARQPVDIGEREPFALVVGRRSAVLVADHEIKAAVRLPPSVRVSIESHGDELELSDLRLGAPPRGSGCE